MNQKASSSPVSLVWAILLGIIILVFIFGGGLSSIYNITKFIGKIPTPVLIVVGIILFFKIIGGKK